MTVLLQVMTLFLLMLAGFTAAKIRAIDSRGMTGLNHLVLYFAQPAMILYKLQTPASPELLAGLFWVFFLACAVIGASGMIAFRIFCKEPAERRAVLTNLCLISNCAFMGYPVIIAALGEDALIYGVFFAAAFNLMCWTLGAYYFGGPGAMQPKKLLTNPSLIAVSIGFVLFLTGWRLPDFVNGALDGLGDTTTPLAMFVIGSRLTGLRREHLTDVKLLLVCALRLLVFPAAVLLLRFTPVPDMAVNIVYLCTAMPCAALTAMQAELYNCDAPLASRGVALSTALSILTVPLLLLLI